MSQNLQEFLASPARPAGTMSYHELCGFLFSIACSPDLVQPSEWLPMIFDDQDPGYADPEETNAILQQIITLYNDVNQQVVSGRPFLPEECQPTEVAEENFTSPLGEWSAGFMCGHGWLSETWDSCLPEELDDELGSCVMVLSYFADPRLAEAYHQEAAIKAVTAGEMARTVVKIFGDAMASYALIGRSLYLALNEMAEEDAPALKVGRNEPCPCGSGKKYKHCCLH